MQKPILIQELEKELKTTFKQVDVEGVMRDESGKSRKVGKAAKYAINDSGKIIGLKIANFDLLELPKNIKEFQELQFLNLSANKISDILALSHLTNLTKLDLSSNQIRDISALSNLTNLTKLYLSNRGIFEKIFLIYFRNLTKSNNQIRDISVLSHLTNLTELYLSGNQINDISALSNLTNITKLYLDNNEIRNISALSHLTNLTELYLWSNQIRDISALSNLTSPKELYLGRNQIRDISALSNLTNLTTLDLRKNPIENLPEWTCKFPNMDISWTDSWKSNHIIFYENPLKEPPIEIVKQGKAAIRNYFKKKKEEGTDYLYEAKLILVGEERAGKSTIAKALTQEDDFELDKNEKSTEGIDILKWMIPKEKTKTPKDFRFNIWDFGGQEMYHTTHQFFLTKRSLYLFITEARKDLRFDDFYYWLNIINSLGGNSRIMAIKNKIDQSSSSNDISEYKNMFPQLLNDTLTGVSCNTDHEKWTTEYAPLLNIFKEKIYDVVKNKQIESMGTPLPKTWVKVREDITTLQGKGIDYITLSEYQNICKQYNFDQETMISLSQLFHDLGVFLHFQDNIKLNNTIFINHEYVTQGVYKIFDDEKIIKSNGEFTDKDLIKILQNTKYVDKQAELINLCEEFKILFQKENGVCLAPQLFKETKPEFDRDFYDSLYYKYSYRFKPKGIVSYLIVEMHKYIYGNYYWRYGVILKDRDAFALIEEKKHDKEIDIKISGEKKNEFLTIIAKKIDEINDRFTNLKVNKKVGCICKECKDSDEMYFFGYDYITKALHKNKETVECQNSTQDIKLLELLGYKELQVLMSKTNKVDNRGDKNITIADVSGSEVNISVGNSSDNNHKNKPVKKKQILIIESQPDDLTNTEANKGISSIMEAWKKGKCRDKFEEPEIRLATNRSEFLHILDSVSPDILHLSLHTNKEEGLIFTDEKGGKDYMSKDEFVKKIKFISEKKLLDLVFINSCNSSIYAEDITPYVGYAIGMTDFIPPKLANLFATKFYKSFFENKNIKNAFGIGIVELESDKNIELPEDTKTAKEDIPKLYKK